MREGARTLRILGRLTGTAGVGSETRRLCEVSAEVTEMSGAGIMVMSSDVPRGSLCTTDEVSGLIEQLQFALGEGPCVDAYDQDRPVLEPDLADPRVPRWLAFTGPAVEAGALAVFGFPIRVGGARLGALSLYRDHRGSLSDNQHADALAMAEVTARAILMLQAGAPPGKLATELEIGADLHAVVHQATGMVAAQLDVTVATALVRLRAHAFGHGRSLLEVACAVVDRELRFDAL